MRKFDPISRDNIQKNVTNYQNEILDLYDTSEYKGKEVRKEGRRYIRWRFIRELERNLTPDFMSKIQRESSNIFLRKTCLFSYQLRNIEEGFGYCLCTLTKAHHGLNVFLMRRNG